METDADETQTEHPAQAGSRRSDRWEADAGGRTLNGWAIVGILVVLAGYGVAALLASAVKGDLEVGDRAGLALVATAPALGALGIALGVVGARRDGVRWLAWIAIALGALLVIASILVIGAVVLAFRSFT